MKNEIIAATTPAEVPPERRSSGILDAQDNWLVLTESERQKDGWVHKCGTPIKVKSFIKQYMTGISFLVVQEK